MKPTFHFLLLLPLTLVGAIPNDAGLRRAIDSTTYRVEASGTGGYTATNNGQHLQTQFNQGVTRFQYGALWFSLELTGAGPMQRTSVNGNRLNYYRPGVTEWFVNEPAGLEQGFTFERKPAAGPLTVTLTVGGDLRPELDGQEVALRDHSQIRLRYQGLKSWDAGGKVLPSRMEVVGRAIRLVVDDAGARYPVTVDPTIKEDKLVTGTEPATANLAQGSAVAIDGNTVVVGAPRWNSGLGAVYVFVRSGSGWTEQARLISPEPTYEDYFGGAVSISGDTVIVGAPLGSNYAGVAYAFVRSAGVWTFQQKLPVVTSVDDTFGNSVAVAGNVAIVGAPGFRSSVPQAHGAGYIFRRTGAVWALQSRRLALADDIVYGSSVAIGGDTVLIGGLRFVQPVAFQSGAWTDQSPRLTPPAGPNLFGLGALAIDGDTALVGDSERDDQKGAAYVFVRAGGAWNAPPVKLAASDGIAGDGFGGSGAIGGNLAVISADGANNSAGVAYLFTRAGTTWSQTARLSPANASPNDAFGRSVAISGITAVVGSPSKRAVANGGRTGAAYTYLFSNVAVYSNPSGRTFKLAGAQCSDAGTFTTPYFGLWDACNLKWTSPETIGASTRYTFENWSDGYTDNPRSLLGNSTYTANFLTEYYLSPRAVPLAGGAVTGESWYKAGTSAGVLAQANPGFVFTSFNAPLNSATNPQSVVINGPVNVVANFAPTPPATLSALITAKSGTPVNRQWTITLTNNGPGVAYSAQLFGMGFTQTFGTVCTVPPIRLSPSAFPVSLGLLNVGSSAQLTAAIDFTGCPATARFTVSVGYMANGGSSLGLLPLVNQFQ